MRVLLSLIGLVLLLLLSPCKVRNYVQAELGVPLTEVSNISKATLNNLNCDAHELSETAFGSSTPSIKSPCAFIAHNQNPTLSASIIWAESVSYGTTISHAFSIVPLYILHQNFKAYLLLLLC